MTHIKVKHLTDADLESLEVGDTVEVLESVTGEVCSGVTCKIVKGPESEIAD